MIWADQEVTEDEYITLKKYCKKFEFLDENITQLADYLLDSAKKNISKEETSQRRPILISFLFRNISTFQPTQQSIRGN